MSLAAASQPAKTAAPPGPAAAQRRDAQAGGFDTLLHNTDAPADAAPVQARTSAPARTDTRGAKPSARADAATAKNAATSDGQCSTSQAPPIAVLIPSAGPIVAGSNPPPTPQGLGSTSASGAPTDATTSTALPQALAPPASSIARSLKAAPLAASGPQETDDDTDAAQAEAPSALDGGSGSAQVDSPTPGGSSVPSRTPADGSAAQPLLDALVGAGATRVTAQVSPRPAAGAAVRSKPTAAGAGPDGKAGGEATGKAAPASAIDPAAPIVLAAAANDDADKSDDAGDRGDAQAQPSLDTGQAELAGGGVTQTAATSTPPPQSGVQAAPLSASAADLAAQMAARVSAGSSQFKLQLNPLGLGQVDVTVSIGANRQLTAALTFADPQTASALSAHAGELRSVLEQAGFSVPANGFDFSAVNTPLPVPQHAAFHLQSGLGGGDGSGQPGGGGRTPHTPFGAGDALLASTAADAAAWAGGADSRLDIRI